MRGELSIPSMGADTSSFWEPLSMREAVSSREDEDPGLSCKKRGFSSVGLRKQLSPQIPAHLIFCLFYKGFSDLRLISDQQNLLLGFSLGVYIVFREINCHLAVLSLQAPQALLSLPSQAVRIKQALGTMIKIHWIEKSTSKKVTYKVKPEFAPASKPLSSEEW